MAAESLCCLEWDSSKPSEVLWRSRGGGSKARPTLGSVTYKVDLGLLLQRAGEMGLQLRRIAVDTAQTRRMSLARRTVQLDPAEVPGDALRPNGVIQLSRLGPGGADRLRARIGTRSAKVGRPPGARGGGNTTRSLRLYFTRPLKRSEVLRLDAPPGRNELVRNPSGAEAAKGVAAVGGGLLAGVLAARAILGRR